MENQKKNRTNKSYFMINPEDLKYEYIEHLSAVTINTDVKKPYVKSSMFVKIKTRKNELKNELDRIMVDIGCLKGPIGK